MTIIAWDGRFIAADKMGVSGDMPLEVDKLIRLDSGEIVGIVGTQHRGLELLEWYKSNRGKKVEEIVNAAINEDCSLVVVNDNKVFHYFNDGKHPFEIKEKIAAFGCGRELAMGAMAAGADALKAVEIACRYNICCGCGITFFEI